MFPCHHHELPKFQGSPKIIHTFFLEPRLVTLYRKNISKRLAPPGQENIIIKKKNTFLHNYCFPHIYKTALLSIFFYFTCFFNLKEGQPLFIWEDNILVNIICAWRLRWPIPCRMEQCHYSYLICSTSNCGVYCLSNPNYNNTHCWV